MDTTGQAGVIPMTSSDLLIASMLMVIVAGVSLWLKLGLTKMIVVSTIRSFVQLLAMGFLLHWIIGYQNPWLVAAVILIMMVAAVQIAISRVRNRPRHIRREIFVTLFVTTSLMLFIVVGIIITPTPLYDARTVITIGGMILGNLMSAIAVALERLFSDMDSRESEINAMVALGASQSEAAWPSIKMAVQAGLIPTLSSLAAAGLVVIPGMMTGQILAGADPLEAAKYQIVVLMMVSATTVIGDVAVVLMSYRKRFSEEGFYFGKGMRDELPAIT